MKMLWFYLAYHRVLSTDICSLLTKPEGYSYIPSLIAYWDSVLVRYHKSMPRERGRGVGGGRASVADLPNT
ncbi:hypothetical protein BDV33DRAFT_182356 [Aspergillus novoparasiticus]|uniref:Uncharacterized protein n=1 Tax=Aspergillus novoparasiticus TaxID=986946 RepID=A0A5N6EBF1_9EURO|nr:hypothetical protein BDV33DRAFT_182356 [Aspergillus novoparasiticus]